MKLFFLCLWLSALGLVGFLATVPHLMSVENGEDKMLHLTVFCVLMVLPAAMLPRRIYVFAMALALFAGGVGIEFAQQYIAGRESSLEDALYNGAGVLIGLVVGYLFRGGHETVTDPRTVKKGF